MLSNLDRETYPRVVLSRVADHPINRIEASLPWNAGAPTADRKADPK
jgi:hypothetical protein